MNKLNILRKMLDETDADIVRMLEKRFDLTRAVGRIKEKENIPVLNTDRETAVLERVKSLSGNNNPMLLENIYKKIIEICRNEQYKAIIDKKIKNNIVLIGFSGSGKSYNGKILSEILNRDFFDTDTLIENAEGRSINDIFLQDGEEKFRELETKQFVNLCGKRNAVIASGGGIVCRSINMGAIKQEDVVVFIDRRFEDIKFFLEKSRGTESRPLLRGKENYVERLYAERYPLYEKYARLTIKCNSVLDITNDILKSLELFIFNKGEKEI